jgi:hypothetical protein
MYKDGTFAPATTDKFLTSWQTNEKERNESFSKLSKHLQKKLYFCTLRDHADTVDRTRRKKEHVPRHIELTAVLRDLKTKNKE